MADLSFSKAELGHVLRGDRTRMVEVMRILEDMALQQIFLWGPGWRAPISVPAKQARYVPLISGEDFPE